MCTQADLLPVLEMERNLRRYHALDISLAYDEQVQSQPAERGSCTHPTDIEYSSFIREVATKMGPDQQLVDRNRQQLFVRVAANGPPWKAIHYALGSGASHRPERFVIIEVRYDSAAKFVEQVNSVILPHLTRMQTSRQRLFDLTGCWIGALSNGDDASASGFMDDMEQALDTVYERIAALDPETLLSIRRERACAGAMLLLRSNEFGSSPDGMQPLDAAGETFLHAIDATRQERARRQNLRR